MYQQLHFQSTDNHKRRVLLLSHYLLAISSELNDYFLTELRIEMLDTLEQTKLPLLNNRMTNKVKIFSAQDAVNKRMKNYYFQVKLILNHLESHQPNLSSHLDCPIKSIKHLLKKSNFYKPMLSNQVIFFKVLNDLNQTSILLKNIALTSPYTFDEQINRL